MSSWVKTMLPPEDEEILGVWLHFENKIKMKCFFSEGRFKAQMPNGDIVEVPVPDFWKYDEDFPATVSCKQNFRTK